MTNNDLKQMMASLIQRQERLTESQERLTEELKESRKKVDEQLAETSREVSKVSNQIGHMGESRGEIAEEFFYRSFENNPNVGDVHFNIVDRHFRNHVGDVTDEYDVVLINGNQVLVIEVKARAKTTDIKRFINKKIPNFRLLFPAYKDYKILAGVASLTSTDNLIAKAKELGVFFFTQQGNHMALMNDEVKVF